MDPEDGWAHAQLGYALSRLKHFDEALAEMEKAKQLDFEEPWNLREKPGSSRN